MKMITILAASAAFVAAPALAAPPTEMAADVTAKATSLKEAQPANGPELDLTIPEAPGFAVIGLSPTTVVDPAAGRMSILDFVPYTDKDGNLKPGFAATVAPFALLQQGMTLRAYRQAGRMQHILARLQLSGGFAEGGDGMPDRFGVGFSTDLFDNSDYRLNAEIYECAATAYAEYFDSPAVRAKVDEIEAKKRADLLNGRDYSKLSGSEKGLLNNVLTETRAKAFYQLDSEAMGINGEAYKGRVKACRDKFKRDFLNQAAWVVAGGAAWKSKGGGLDGEREFDGGSLWTSFRLPLGRRQKISSDAPAGGALADDGGGGLPNYLTVFGRYDFDKEAEIPGGVQEYDKFTAAGVLGYVWSSGAKLSGEAGYERVNYRGTGLMKDSGSEFYAATLTYPVARGIWLELKGGASKSNPAAPTDKDNKVTLTFHWAPPQN